MRTAVNFGIVLLVALGITVLPGGGSGLQAFLTILIYAFFVAIALLGYRLYRENRFTLDSLGDRLRLVLYGAIGLAFLTFTASERLFGVGLPGVVVWLALLGLCSYGVYWVYLQSRAAE
ncbi:MAG TPA: hypothetical protein VGR10_00690 [Thermoleophilaceae bacterium]|nr:hypothetical protein [Thermoleophilaceae bacterium]